MMLGIIHKFLPLLVACNYFAFRVELIEDEYKENHPPIPDVCSFTRTSLNWETFDKDNAPKAFVVNTEIQIEFICYSERCVRENLISQRSPEPVKDKSPPR